MKTIKQILITRDNMEPTEADDLIEAAQEELLMWIDEGNFEAAEEICADWFGLEPDFLEELISWHRPVTEIN